MIRLARKHFCDKFAEAKKKAMALYKSSSIEAIQLKNKQVDLTLKNKNNELTSVTNNNSNILEDFAPIETARIKSNFGSQAKLRVEHGVFIYAKPQIIDYSIENGWYCIFVAQEEKEFAKFKRFVFIMLSFLAAWQLNKWYKTYATGKLSFIWVLSCVGAAAVMLYLSVSTKNVMAKSIHLDFVSMSKLKILFQNGKTKEINVKDVVYFANKRKHHSEMTYLEENKFRQVLLTKRSLFDPNLFRGIAMRNVLSVEFDNSFF